MSSPLADSPYALAREMERRSRTEQPRRTPEAQADIAAARAAPKADDPPPTCVLGQERGCIRDDGHIGLCRRWDGTVLAEQPAPAPTSIEVAMQEVDRQIEDVGRELRESAPPPDLDAALSNATLADTPAVREMGGPAGGDSAAASEECARLLARDAEFLRAAKDPSAIILRGPEAERYRAIVAAARKAHASAAALKADSTVLTQLFQAFCAGLTPGKAPGE